MSVGTDMYKSVTGKSAWGSVSEDECDLRGVYVEAYTKDYIKWLESYLPAQPQKQRNAQPTADNTASAPFISCVHCVHLEQETLNCKLDSCVNKQRT